MADLTRITGIDAEFAELLEAAGVDTIIEIELEMQPTFTRGSKKFMLQKV
jgi:hypothetical protein